MSRPPQSADALPLLALTLERLYRDFGADGDLTVAEYESMGGMAEVVQTEVDKLLASDPAERQAQLDILHDAFIPWLATINPDNNEPMRRLARWDDLPAASRPLIQRWWTSGCWSKTPATGRPWSRLRWKACCANGANWRPGCATRPRTSRTPTHGARRHRLARQRQNESWLLEGTRLTDAETLCANPGFRDRLDPTRDFVRPPVGAKTTDSRPRSNASKPNCKPRAKNKKPPRDMPPRCGNAPESCAPCWPQQRSSP